MYLVAVRVASEAFDHSHVVLDLALEGRVQPTGELAHVVEDISVHFVIGRILRVLACEGVHGTRSRVGLYTML